MNVPSSTFDRFLVDFPAGLPAHREGIAHAIPIKPGMQSPPAKCMCRLTYADRQEVEAELYRSA